MALDHYVSQVHLKQFYSPALGELMFAIRKSDLKRFTPDAKSVCRLQEGSTNKYLSEPRAIEEFLKPIESNYNAAVEVLQAGKPDQQTIYVVAGFVSYILSCSPTAMRINSVPLKGSVELTAKLLDAKGKFGPPPKELGGNSLTELMAAGKIKVEIDSKYPQAIGIANILRGVATFGNFMWEILENEHADCPFFTSDFPVAPELTRDPMVQNRIVPLTPNVAIRMLPNTELDRHSPDFEFGQFRYVRKKLKRSEAVHINRLLARSAEDHLFFRDDLPWIEKFVTKNRDYRMNGENIEIPMPEGTAQISRQSIAPFKWN